ncbi:MAG: hypothetical protein ACXVRK_12295 [Gaiellaceae bacterium]
MRLECGMAVLVCIECEREGCDGERGWAGYLVVLDDDGEDEVAIFCPDCAAREFGRRRHG